MGIALAWHEAAKNAAEDPVGQPALRGAMAANEVVEMACRFSNGGNRHRPVFPDVMACIRAVAHTSGSSNTGIHMWCHDNVSWSGDGGLYVVLVK